MRAKDLAEVDARAGSGSPGSARPRRSHHNDGSFALSRERPRFRGRSQERQAGGMGDNYNGFEGRLSVLVRPSSLLAGWYRER
jgi:hypothetical protein